MHKEHPYTNNLRWAEQLVATDPSPSNRAYLQICRLRARQLAAK